MNRVVITGMGAITPIGNDIETFWKNLIAGKNGIGKITHFDTEGFKATLAAEVKEFEPTDYIEKKEARKMDRFCQFALAAACQAGNIDPAKLSGASFTVSNLFSSAEISISFRISPKV